MTDKSTPAQFCGWCGFILEKKGYKRCIMCSYSTRYCDVECITNHAQEVHPLPWPLRKEAMTIELIQLGDDSLGTDAEKAYLDKHKLEAWYDEWPESPDEGKRNPHDPYYSDIEEHEHVKLTCPRCKQQFEHKCEEVRE